MNSDLAAMTAVELLADYRNHALSPVEVTRACLNRIERLDGAINAFIEYRPREALAAAEASEKRWRNGDEVGLVDGVPVAAKDLTPLKGYPFRRGSKTTTAEICTEDAPCLARLRDEGAIFLGKTTTPEFGWKGVTDSPLTGVTRNPWNLEKTPGGSSGGAAAAVASGMCHLAEGTDGGGSIRMPAAFTGIFGLYPTAGRIPYYPLSILGTMSQCGPMTRSVSDGALMFTAMAGPDSRDPIGLSNNELDWRVFLNGGVQDMKIAYSATLGFAKVDADVANVVENAVSVLAQRGARIVPVERVFDDPRGYYETIFRVGMERIRQTVPTEQQNHMDPGLLAMAEEGRRIATLDYAEAISARERWAVAMNDLMQRFDVLVTPQLPITAFDAGLEYPPGRGMTRWLDWNPFGYPFNFTNSPAATMPCGFSADGLPIAFQVVAPRYREDLIFRVCSAFEKVQPIQLPDVNRIVPR